MAIEKELKLALGDANVQDAIRFLESACEGSDALAGNSSKPSVGITFTLGNVYFDTADLDLAQSRVALRLRNTPTSWLQTLKTAGRAVNGLHARGEWEMPVSGESLDLPALLTLCDDPAAKAALSDLAPRLGPIFRTDFERTTWLIRQDGATLEVALDIGTVHLGASDYFTRSDLQQESHQIPIREIEIELKHGDESALLAFAQKLQLAIPGLKADDVSKAARGYQLVRESNARLASDRCL